MLDVLVDDYLPIVERVGAELDAIEDRIFDPGQPADHTRILRLKRGMSALRRIIGPQRDAVLALTRDEFRSIPQAMRPYLRDVYDRIARDHDLLDSYRDEISTVFELQITMTSNRLNEVIKRLTVLATIGLPLTVVTSYFGMNFEFGEYKLAHPHLFALGLLLASGVATLWYLRRRRWDWRRHGGAGAERPDPLSAPPAPRPPRPAVARTRPRARNPRRAPRAPPARRPQGRPPWAHR